MGDRVAPRQLGDVDSLPQSAAECERLYREGHSRFLATAVVGDTQGRSARTELLRAMALFDIGQVTSSLAKLSGLVHDQTGDTADRFEASLALFLRASDFQAPDELLPSLTELRQLAALNGNALALASLHLAVARLEGLRGRFLDAQRHLALSRRIAALAADGTLSCRLDLVEGSLECLSGNLDRSQHLNEHGYRLALQADFAKYKLGFATNLGVLALYKGQAELARAELESVVKAAAELTYVRFGALDTLAQVALFADSAHACRQALDACEEVLTSDHRPAPSWYELASQITRCSYHERLEDWTTILDLVDASGPEAERRQYRSVATALFCARARALAHLGEHASADTALGTAVRTCPKGAVDPLIVLEASKGLCSTLRGDDRAGSLHFDRAVAGCEAIGHQYHRHWITAIRERATSRGSVSVGRRVELDTTDAALLLNDVSTLLGAGHSVDLMAHRLISIIESTPLRSQVTVERASECDYQAEPSATWGTTSDGEVQIQLRGSDRDIRVRVGGVRTVEEFSFLKSLADIVLTGVTRTTATEHDHDQNLWPLATSVVSDNVVLRSPRMVELLKIAMKLAGTDLPVLIMGETGTGKEVFAKLIHENSRVKRGPFVPFNCATVPRDLVESQLFGHRRGAFTGAHESFSGLIRSAEKGTLFLDEVGDLDLSAQPKLLRFLESGEVHPLGEVRPQKVDVRLVAATNAPLDALVRDGRFRQDLLYRLGGAVLVLPPLRERKDEIPALASFLLARSAAECGRSGVRLGDDFVAALLLYDWPGNVRELSNEIRRAVALADDSSVLGARHLGPAIAKLWHARPDVDQVPAAPGVHIRLDQTLPQAMSELEERFIAHAMQTSGGRVAEAAQLLGLSRKGLFLKRRRRGLVSGRADDDAAER